MQSYSNYRNLSRNQQPYQLPLQPHPYSRALSKTSSPFSTVKATFPNEEMTTSHLKILEAEDYSALQLSMELKLKNLQENIKICKQKSKIKDKEMQSSAQLIDKLSKKIQWEEKKLKKTEKNLQKISTKCQQMTVHISNNQGKITKQAVYLQEQANKYSSLQETITNLEHAIKEAQSELERKQKLSSSLQALHQENSNLRQYHSQLVNEQKMLDYRRKQGRAQYQDLQKKKQHLSKVLNDRLQINKKNSAKLSKLIKQLLYLQESMKHKQFNMAESKNVELQIGDLNQQLLITNQEISEIEFKIKRKQHSLEQIKSKINRLSQVESLTSEQNEEDEKSSIELGNYAIKKKRSISYQQQQEQNLDKNSSSKNKGEELTRETPHFPSNPLFFNSEPPLKVVNSVEQRREDKEAFKNIQKLIKRYQQIKTKEKSTD